MAFRLSTASTANTDGVDYVTGDLSLYPELLDDEKSLYIAANNAETKLRQTLTYNGKYIIVNDATAFPTTGVLRLGSKAKPENFELVYYNKRNDTTFMELVRGFVGSKQDNWPANETYVSNSVNSQYHNAIKDAILKVEQNLGLKEQPDAESLNGILIQQENKFLAPRPIFRAFPKAGPPALTVKFQNFSNSEAIRFLWDFGDGTTSSEKNPVHVYQTEGIYSVKLNMLMTTGAQGVTTKTDYITVAETEITPFFYAKLIDEDTSTYQFMDQTDGDISIRYWVFGDGVTEEIKNPNIHFIEHTYETPGDYNPSLLIVFKNLTTQKVFLKESITVE